MVLHDSLRAAELLTITAGKLRPKVEVDHLFPDRALLGDETPET